MKRKAQILIRREKISRELRYRILMQYAKEASADAKRSSNALDIPFDIIKNDGIYQVFNNSMIKTASVLKVKSEKMGLTKGSKISLK
jgi:hypothetical protein